MQGLTLYVIAAVFELSQLLNTGLDRDSLGILVSLIEKGVNPEALAAAVKEMRRAAAKPNVILLLLIIYICS